MAVKPIPDGNHTITPYLPVVGAEKLVAFLEQAFGAAHTDPPMKRPDGSLAHAQLQIGSSRLMLGEASNAAECMPCMLYLYVQDCDAVHAHAVAAGAESIMLPTDMFYGDRSGGVKDAWGNQWWIATHVEDVAPAEMERRMAAEMKKRAAQAKQEGAG